MNKWKIEQFKMKGSPVEGKWYVYREGKLEWCGVRFGYFADTEYLHADGVARPSTENNGTWSGYFETEEQAKELIG